MAWPRQAATQIAIAVVLCCCAAHAEPLVKMDGGKPAPGVVTKWEKDGKDVLLTVRDGVDAGEVAAAINDGVAKVKAKVKAGRVQVKGKSEADLLKALSTVEFGQDDFGALAAADMGNDDVDSGSSLRAKKSADIEKLLADADTTALGTVAKVDYGQFPQTTVTVRVLRGPKGDLAKTIRKGKNVAFVPALKVSGKGVDWTDEATQLNVGAWFLKKGDRVVVKIGKKTKGGFEATVLDRQ